MLRHGQDGQGYFIELKKSYDELKKEVGGHRFIHNPMNDRKGKTHTSLVRVYLVEEKDFKSEVKKDDCRITQFSGTGPGGQRKNKAMTSVRVLHIPSGIMKTCQGRNMNDNIEFALNEIQKELDLKSFGDKVQYTAEQSKLSGCGAREDKIRTYRINDNVVINHLDEKRISYKDFQKGKINLFWASKTS